MNATHDLANVPVSAAMSEARFSVSPTQKIEDVAKLFQQNEINSAPVVDEFNRCVGIITSHDIVRFQSELSEANARIDQGLTYEITERDTDGSIELVPHPFDEVQRQMTATVQTIDEAKSLLLAARIMCEQHVHHLIVLDGSEHPIGILSSLDILAKLNE